MLTPLRMLALKALTSDPAEGVLPRHFLVIYYIKYSLEVISVFPLQVLQALLARPFLRHVFLQEMQKDIEWMVRRAVLGSWLRHQLSGSLQAKSLYLSGPQFPYS